jgi:hypothetical protein
MKKCPNCHQIYDVSENFCAKDGAILIAAQNSGQMSSNQQFSAEIPTQVVSKSHSSGEMPTQVFYQPTPVQNVVPRQNDNSKWLFLVIGVLLTALLGMALYLFLPNRNNEKTEAAETKKEATPEPESKPQKPKSSFIQNEKPSLAPPTANTAFPANVARPATSPSGNWSGDWASPSGAYLRQNVSLSEDGNGNVTGQIQWTLVRTNRPEKMSKIGMSATEYVSGKYDPYSQSVTLQGYRKDDPNGVLVMLDSYRLKLSGNNLSGLARNGGKWNGRMSLSR